MSGIGHRCEAFRSETREELRGFSPSNESLDDFRYAESAQTVLEEMLHSVPLKGVRDLFCMVYFTFILHALFGL
ncbi:hypothetical protein GCM10023156_29020 [Novipirellula rosea]|uniref:Uncharacterized protein n=1 Tax=Novipirellula rosea TaxID=1031540 RepID=A0ABP8MW17_9BACT